MDRIENGVSWERWKGRWREIWQSVFVVQVYHLFCVDWSISVSLFRFIYFTLICYTIVKTHQRSDLICFRHGEQLQAFFSLKFVSVYVLRINSICSLHIITDKSIKIHVLFLALLCAFIYYIFALLFSLILFHFILLNQALLFVYLSIISVVNSIRICLNSGLNISIFRG